MGARALAAEGAEGEGEGGKEGAKSVLPDWFKRDVREYFTMPPFVIPVIGSDAVTRQVTLLVTIETIGIDNKEKMLDNRRRLQDAYLRDLYGVLAFRRADEQIYNLDAIQTRLRRISDQIMGSGIIDTVVVKTTLDRRFSASDR